MYEDTRRQDKKLVSMSAGKEHFEQVGNDKAKPRSGNNTNCLDY